MSNLERTKNIEQIKSILTEWPPLGSEAEVVLDLNTYLMENQDIYVHITCKPKSTIQNKRNQKIIGGILDDGFGFWLTEEESQVPIKNSRSFRSGKAYKGFTYTGIIILF